MHSKCCHGRQTLYDTPHTCSAVESSGKDIPLKGESMPSLRIMPERIRSDSPPPNPPRVHAAAVMAVTPPSAPVAAAAATMLRPNVEASICMRMRTMSKG